MGKRAVQYLFLAVLLILVCVCTWFVYSGAKQTSYMSAVSWLRTAILEELHGYYVRHGTYPQTLDDLNIPFPGDNAKPEMLKLFTYELEGDSFRLILKTGSEEGYRYEYVGVRGRVVRCEEYLGGRLVGSSDSTNPACYTIRFGK